MKQHVGKDRGEVVERGIGLVGDVVIGNEVGEESKNALGRVEWNVWVSELLGNCCTARKTDGGGGKLAEGRVLGGGGCEGKVGRGGLVVGWSLSGLGFIL